MPGRTKYLRLAAFVPAIVLVSGFIGYRAGAFQLFPQPEPQPQPEAQPEPAAAPEQMPVVSQVPAGGASFMAGSKSVMIATELPAGTATANTPNSAPGATPPATPAA